MREKKSIAAGLQIAVSLVLGANTACSEDPCGSDDTSWIRLLDSDAYMLGEDVEVDLEGHAYVTGAVIDAGYRLLLAKYDADGTLLWSIEPTPNAYGSGLAIDDAGDVFVTGSIDGDMMLAKYSPDGTRLWIVEFGTTEGWDEGNAVTVDRAGAIYVAGATAGTLAGTSAGGKDMIVSKYGDDGTKLWTRQIGTSVDDAGLGIAVDSAGGVYVTGTSYSGPADDEPFVSDMFLAKYDSDGVAQWTRQLGSPTLPEGVRVVVDSADEVYVSGSTWAGNQTSGSSDLFVTKYGPDGTKRWSRELGASTEETASDMAVDGANNIYVTGTTDGDLDGNTSAGGDDVFVSKYGPDGTKHWTQLVGLATDDDGRGVAVSQSGVVYVTGTNYGEIHQVLLSRVCNPD